MNEKFNMRYLNRLMYIGGTILITTIVIWILNSIGFISLLFSLLNALFPVLLAISISYLLEPIIFFLGRRRIKRRFAVPIVYLTLAGIIALLLWIIIPALVNQLKDFFVNLPILTASLEKEFDKITSQVGVNVSLKSLINDVVDNISNYLIKQISSIVNIFITISIAITGAVFLSFDFQRFRNSVRDLLPNKKKESVVAFFHEFLPIIHRYISAILINNTLLFIFSTIILYFCNVSYPALFGLILAVTKFIPVIGSYLGALPLALIGFAVSWQKGLYYIFLVTVIQFIESNIMAPIIVKGRMRLKPIENLIGVAILGKLFGFIGMISSPIVITGLKIFFSQRRERKADLIRESIANKEIN